MFQASYHAHVFGRHVHEALAVGVVDAGVGSFWCRRVLHVAPAHTLVLINVGDVHTGGVHTADAPLSYRMLYLPLDLLTALSPAAPTLAFTHPAPYDPSLATTLRQLHSLLGQTTQPLAAEATLLDALALLTAHYGASQQSAVPAGAEGRAVAVVRDYLHAHWDQPVSLRELGALVGLHPAYLNRSFRQTVGLPPHAYQLHLRIDHAKALLAAGADIADVAVASGFTDQSHLTRQFRRQQGLTPARYQAAYGARHVLPLARPALLVAESSA
ncbi:MAG: AraC family transcriptional regulator [Chloroflexales bacterium]|nr:AraC family transcriptional regulator [Chloroflexales bacterium]